MNEKLLDAYADIIVSVGVNLYKGQCLTISTGKDNYDFALRIARAAYKRGARYVDISCRSSALTRERLAHGREDDFTFLPQFYLNKCNEMLANDWASISIDATEELDMLKDADPAKLQTVTRAVSTVLKRRSDELMKNKHPWCVVASPGPKWAAKVLGCQPDEAAMEKLWQVLIPVLRLDKDDPVQAWQDHVALLAKRANFLNERQLDRLHFAGPDTDLTVGLNKTSRWAGGLAHTPDNRPFLPMHARFWALSVASRPRRGSGHAVRADAMAQPLRQPGDSFPAARGPRGRAMEG